MTRQSAETMSGAAAPVPLSEAIATQWRPEPQFVVAERMAVPASEPLRILLVEDDPRDVFLLMAAFSQAGIAQFKLEHVDLAARALERLEQGGIDLVLLDLGLPDGCGLELVARVRAAAPHLPIVVLTGLDDLEMALAAIQAGAQDYLVKSATNAPLLARAMGYAAERQRITDALRRRSAELSSANERLRELDQRKDEFISRVSHELRTPIAAIYQFSSILADGLAGETSSEQREYLEIVLRNTRNLRDMVGELIEATRAEAGKLGIRRQSVLLPLAVEEVLATERAIALAKGIALEADVPSDLPPAYADPQRLRQILINLVDNAIKFTPEGGAVTVRARLSAHALAIAVQDTGEGMCPEVAEHVFERLFQDERLDEASRQGLGLGLYLCKQLVDALGGSIQVESAPGSGSTFTFSLPVFSLPEILQPALASGARLAPRAAIFAVEMFQVGRFVSKRAMHGALLECRALLEGRAPAGSVVLPEMSRTGAPGRIVVVASSSPDQAPVLAERLREEISRLRGAPGLEPRLVFQMLDLRQEAELPLGSALAAAAAKIQERIHQPVSRWGSVTKEE